MKRRLIEGRGGGGGGGEEAPNTLRSSQIVEAVLLLEEGEIQGIVNGLKSVYLDQVPVQNADGSLNFDDVSFSYVTGAPNQAALPGINAVQNEVAVGVTVTQATPVVRSITNASVDKVRVTIFVPQLSELATDRGNLNGYQFQWAIDIQASGGGYVERHNETIKGKTMSGYSRAVVLELTGSAPWNVRVRRISPAPPSNVNNAFSWASYTEIQSIRLRYQNSAVAVLRVSSKAFTRVPEIQIDAMHRLVQVPSNYNPITRVYTGTWNGTFVDKWTNCPPWVLFDAITDPRAGAGNWVPSTISNKWTLYAIGQYSDALVPDGRGGQEPRFTINVDIERRTDAFRLIRDLAAVFRGMVFWASGQVDFAQDAPGDETMIYTPANVVDGKFTYADVSEKTRHSVFITWWSDQGQFGKLVPEIYVDDVLVARYGLKELEIAPLGITSRGQAARCNRWARYSEEMEGEVVTFEVGSDGIAVAPGRTFRIADPNEQGERLGGRIKTATTTVVTLDAPITLAAGETYTLSVIQADATDPTKLTLQTRTVTTAAGTVSAVTVASAFSPAPQAGSVCVLESTGIGATTWRCLAVEEVKNSRQFRITAIAHNPAKFDAIELGLTLDQRPVSRLTTVPPRPASVTVTEAPYRVGTQSTSRVTVSWPEPARGLTYRVGWRIDLGPWTVEADTSANSVDIDGLSAGNFDCWVQSVNALGNVSPLREATTTALLGKTTVPSNVSGEAYSIVQRGVLISWLRPIDADYLETEIRIGASWAAGAVLFRGASNSYEWVLPALGSYTLWLKHRDTSQLESATAKQLTVNVTSAVYVQWGDVTGTGKPLDALNWYFEKGTTDGWSNLASVVADASASGGWYGLANTGTSSAIRPVRPVPIDTSRVYRVRGRVRRTSGSAGSLNIGVVCLDSTGAAIGNSGGGVSRPYAAIQGAAVPGDSVWRTFEGLITGQQTTPSALTLPNKFFPGTVQGTPVAAKSAAWDGDLQIDYLELVDVTDAVAAEAASFTAYKVWDFKRGQNDWTAVNCTFAASAGGFTATGTVANWSLRKSGLSFQGAQYDRLRMKLRRVSGTDWEGTTYYLGTNVSAYSNSFRKDVPEPGRNWQVVEWNMADLTAGGTDWTDSEITNLRLDLAGTVGDAFEIEWIALGKLAPAGDVTDVSGAVWVGRGAMVNGNTAQKVKATSAWDADVYSQEWAVGGCFASAQFGANNIAAAFGLNSDPATDSNITSLDYCFRSQTGGAVQIWESNVNRGTVAASFDPADVFLVTYDGFKFRYFQNQTLLREVVATTPGAAYYFDSALFTPGAQLKNMRFGPLSPVTGIDTGQLVPGSVDVMSRLVSTKGTLSVIGETGYDRIVVTPTVDCVAEVVVICHAEATGSTSAWGGAREIGLFSCLTSDLTAGGGFYTLGASAVRKAKSDVPQSRSIVTLAENFDVAAGQSYGIGLYAKGSNPDTGINYFATIYGNTVTIKVTLIQR